MNRIGITCLIIVIMTVCVMFSGCILPTDILVEDESPKEESAAIWNLSAFEDNFVWEYGEEIYAYMGGWYLYRTDLNFSYHEKVIDDMIQWPSLQDGKIFYQPQEGTDSDYIMSCDLNGKNNDKILKISDSNNVLSLYDSGEFTYYSQYNIMDEKNTDGFFRIDNVTGKKEKINDDEPCRFINQGGLIYYYIAEPRKSAIKIYDPATGEVKDATTWENIIKFFPDNVIGDYLYYPNHNNNKMYRIKSDGTNKQELFDLWDSDNGLMIKIYKGAGYYLGDSIGTVDLETGDRKALISGYDDCTGIGILNDTIFFSRSDAGQSDRLCRMDLDGGNYSEINL